jgi:hypothetical protein
MSTSGSVIAFWQKAREIYQHMGMAYEDLTKMLREQPIDNEALCSAQAKADALGTRYERFCDRICRTEATTLEGVLAKLECAKQCIRDIVPDGTDPEETCDIELRFVFAVERDVRRLIADRGRNAMSRRRPAVAPGSRETQL